MLSQIKHKVIFLFFVNRNPHIFPAKKHVVEKIEIIIASHRFVYNNISECIVNQH